MSHTLSGMLDWVCSSLLRLCTQADDAKQEGIRGATSANLAQLLQAAHLHGDVCLSALAVTPEPPQEDLNLCRTCLGIYIMQQGNLHAASSLERLQCGCLKSHADQR